MLTSRSDPTKMLHFRNIRFPKNFYTEKGAEKYLPPLRFSRRNAIEICMLTPIVIVESQMTKWSKVIWPDQSKVGPNHPSWWMTHLGHVRTAESESRPELESVGVNCFGRSRQNFADSDPKSQYTTRQQTMILAERYASSRKHWGKKTGKKGEWQCVDQNRASFI